MEARISRPAIVYGAAGPYIAGPRLRCPTGAPGLPPGSLWAAAGCVIPTHLAGWQRIDLLGRPESAWLRTTSSTPGLGPHPQYALSTQSWYCLQ